MSTCRIGGHHRQLAFSTAQDGRTGRSLNGAQLPDAIGEALGALRPALEHVGVGFYLGGGARFVETWAWICVAAVLAFAFPNSQQITRRFRPALGAVTLDRSRVAFATALLTWRPTRAWAVAIGVMAVLSLLSLNRPSEFLYFQF